MLGRKNYTQEEFDHGKAAIMEQLAAYKELVGEITSGTNDNKLQSALKTLKDYSSTI